MSDNSMTRTGQIDRGRGAQFSNPADMDQIWRLLSRMVSTDSSLLDITYGSRGITFTPKAPRQRAKQTTEDVAAASDFATPFEGSIHADLDKITIGAGRGAGFVSFDPAYLFFDTITIGLDTSVFFAPETTTAIAATSFVYYKITKSGSSVSRVIEHSVAYPVQVHGELFVVLGRAVWDGLKISIWTQYHFGDISMHARFA